MQKRSITTKSLIQQLQTIAMQTGDHYSSLKKELINQIESLPKMAPGSLIKYHDCLLAILTYPENKELFDLSNVALNKIKKEVAIIFSGTNRQKQTTLTGTGIAGSQIIGSFSYSIACWLSENFSEDVEIDSSLADAETARLFFRQSLPRIEYEQISDGELTLLQRIKRLKGNNKITSLCWVLQQLESSDLPERTKEFLFHSLKVYIKWKLNHSIYNRSSSQSLNNKIFYHKEIIRQAETKKLVTKKIPAHRKLSAEEKKHLISTARSTLAFLYRETEPFTYADKNEVTCFELERGLSIVLYGMIPERRLAIESYIGYLALKNGIPVAYGGGWIFGTRCQFGINILPPFRGGESSLLFANLLRVYKQQFGIRCFAVKPYQFGKNNLEALQSGAFWFYYKHGFRPEQKDLQRLADKEWGKKVKNKKYRTSISLLKKFTTSNLILYLSKDFYPGFDAAKISTAITYFLNEKFTGERNIAVAVCLRKTKARLNIKTLSNWNKYEINALQEWSLLAQACLDLTSWSNNEKKKFVGLIKTKGSGPEMSFIKSLQKHNRFWKSLS